MIEAIIGFVVGVVVMGAFYLYRQRQFTAAMQRVDGFLDELTTDLILTERELEDERSHSKTLEVALDEATAPVPTTTRKR